jgi:arginyl-tRNA synthetase
MAFTGYKVVRDNHVGDSGTPFGKWVAGFLNYSSDEALAKEGIYELARIYVKITEEIKAEQEKGETALQDQVQEWLQKLEAGDERATEYSKRFNKLSFDHMHEIMQRLNIEVDEELGESFYVRRGQELTNKLLEEGVAEKSDGAVIVDLEDKGIETPMMLRKANGTALYSTTDLATIDYREQQWNPEKVFIHTGQEQAFYFQQLKALARKAGYKDNIVHLWHGLVDMLDEDGKRSKMSSRKGVVLLEEFLDKAEEKAKELSKDGAEQDVRAVALAAVKFADFKSDRKTGLLFDWEDMFSLSGFSGPAVQYAAVRINSILAKTEVKTSELDESYDWQAEKQLLLQVAMFPQLLAELGENYQMQKLAHYLYELASEFNRYYEKTPILKADTGVLGARVWTIELVRDVLTTGLDILGISVPKKM